MDIVTLLIPLIIPALTSLSVLEIPDSVYQVIVTQDIVISSMNGTRPEYADIGQPVTLSSTITSFGEMDQPFTVVFEARDSEEVTQFLAWSSASVSPFANTTIGVSWMPLTADDYQIRTFVVDDLEDPEVINGLASTRFEVMDTDHTRITFIDHPPNTRIVPANLSLSDAQALTKKVFEDRPCDIYSAGTNGSRTPSIDVLPNNVTFEFLDIDYPLISLHCWYYDGGATISIVNGTVVYPEGFLVISTPEQAVEYLSYYPLHSSMLYGTENYPEGTTEGALVSQSPVKRMHVIDDGYSFTVKLNVLDVNSGQLRYERWNIKPHADEQGFHEWNPEYSVVLGKLGYIA